MLLLLLALALVTPVYGQDTAHIPPKPLRKSNAIWPHLDHKCDQLMARASVTDLDTFPVPGWSSSTIPRPTRNRLTVEVRKMLETVDLWSIHDEDSALLVVNLDVSLKNQVFFARVDYERNMKFPPEHGRKHLVRTSVWHRQTYGLNFGDVDVAIDKTLDYVKVFISYYLAMNKCGEGPVK